MVVQTLMKVVPLPNSSEIRKKTQITALTPMIWTLNPPIKSMVVMTEIKIRRISMCLISGLISGTLRKTYERYLECEYINKYKLYKI
jgi:hypothetical protein